MLHNETLIGIVQNTALHYRPVSILHFIPIPPALPLTTLTGTLDPTIYLIHPHHCPPDLSEDGCCYGIAKLISLHSTLPHAHPKTAISIVDGNGQTPS